MFDIFAKLLSSIASFLFPVFASYKALKTSDPAQLTPWLMYWVVLACALLVESWVEFILVWIPFYAYIRLFFLLYLVLPQTQGARLIYQEYVHPYLEDNETQIEDFIASAHERLRAAGISYLKRAIELLKTNVLGLPPSPEPASAAATTPPATPASYTQTLLARFSLPSARWNATTEAAGAVGNDFFNLLAGAVSAATGAATGATGGTHEASDKAVTGALIPESIRGSTARMTFIAAQRERLNIVLSALEREATKLEKEDEQQRADREQNRVASMSLDGGSDEPTQRPASGLSKSRSEVDFEKLDAESGTEEMEEDVGARKRPSAATRTSSSWVPWGWGSGGAGSEAAKSSGLERE